MKTLLNISFLLFLLNPTCYSQFYADSVLSDDIVEFVNIAFETTETEYEYRNPKREFTNDELDHLLNLYYTCYSKNLVCFNDYMAGEHKKWEKRMKESEGKSEELRPWMKVYALTHQLSNKYGYKFISIMSTPAFIRGKFIELTFFTHILKGTNTQFRVHNFIFVVEEVLKGDKYFFTGDTISIDMIPNDENPAPSFNLGKSYLVPVTTLLGHQDDGFNTIFVYLTKEQTGWVMGKSPTTFPIENEIIKNCEYFGIPDTSWTDFKKYFEDTYLIFE